MLNGKTALITGANGGIGRSVVDIFLKNGANVICMTRSKDIKFRNYVKKFSNNFSIIQADLTDEAKLKAEINKLFSRKKKLDILVNNAGKASGSIVEMTSQKILKDIFDINFFSQIRITQLLLRYLKNSQHPRIINIGSIYAKIPDKGTLAYGCSKVALMHATKIMANEFLQYNINVNGICPIATKTKMLKKMDPKAKEELILKSFSKKACKPIDVANLILFIASKKAKFINGQIIYMDGGI